MAKINNTEYRIIIPKKLFFVTDNNGIPVNQFEVSINHQRMEGDSMEVLEAYYQQGLTISISSRGFAEWRKSNVRPPLDRQLTVYLSKQVFHYEFSIPVYDGNKDLKNDAIIIVETDRKFTSSPIKGYTNYGDRIQEGEGHINRLSWDDRWLNKIKYAAYGFAACFLILMLYAACENYEFNFGWPPIKEIKHSPNNNWNTANVEIEDVGQLNTDSVNAINYLETNGTWHKDNLDSFEATKGLFEESNILSLKIIP